MGRVNPPNSNGCERASIVVGSQVDHSQETDSPHKELFRLAGYHLQSDELSLDVLQVRGKYSSNFIRMRFSFELKIINSIFCQFCSLSGSFNNQVTSVVVIIVLHE